jgi:hypothetical protein
MHTRTIATLCAATATALMAFALGTASARNLSISNQQIRGTFNDLELADPFATDHCRVTLEGSLHARTIAKSPNALLGYITRAIAGQCTVGTTILTETLPWHVRYVGFSGRLPNITLLLIRTRYAFRFSFCRADTEINARFIRNTTTGQLTQIEVPLQEIPVEGFGCEPLTFRSNANGSVFLLGTTNLIFVTLI